MSNQFSRWERPYRARLPARGRDGVNAPGLVEEVEPLAVLAARSPGTTVLVPRLPGTVIIVVAECPHNAIEQAAKPFSSRLPTLAPRLILVIAIGVKQVEQVKKRCHREPPLRTRM